MNSKNKVLASDLENFSPPFKGNSFPFLATILPHDHTVLKM
jgi:hypothetical protein